MIHYFLFLDYQTATIITIKSKSTLAMPSTECVDHNFGHGSVVFPILRSIISPVSRYELTNYIYIFLI